MAFVFNDDFVRAACTAGSNSAMRIAMIAITTSNSISVKPRVEALRVVFFTVKPLLRCRAEQERPNTFSEHSAHHGPIASAELAISIPEHGWRLQKAGIRLAGAPKH